MINTNIFYFFVLVILTSIVGLGYSLHFNRKNTLAAILTAPLFSYTFLCILAACLSFGGLHIGLIALPLGLLFSLIGIGLLYKYFCNKNMLFEFNTNDSFMLILVILFALLNAFIILTPVLRHNSWYFFNDHTTYIVQSEYLQSHGYYDIPNVSQQPWTDNMYYYQQVSGRMGAQFFLALSRSLSGVKHTIQIYPAYAAFAEYLIILSVSHLCLMIKKNWIFLLIALILMTFAININHWVIILGFLPQAFGIALFVALTANLIQFSNNEINFELLSSNFILFAGLVLIYQEIVPFFVINVLVVSIYLIIIGNKNIQGYFYLFLSFFLSLLLFPISSMLMVKGVLSQLKAVVGWNLKTSFFDYLLIIFGQDSFNKIVGQNKYMYLPGVLGVFYIVYSAFRRKLQRNSSYYVLLISCLLYLCVILYFRFFKQNPFDNTTGQVWSIYKLFQWSYWSYLVLCSYTLSLLIKRNHTYIFFTFLAFISFLPSFFYNFKQLRFTNTTLNVIQAIGGVEAPLKQYNTLINYDGTSFAPANIFFHDIHPNIAYIVLSILKDRSRGVFLPPDDSLVYVKDEEVHNPIALSKYFQWVYFKDERASSVRPVKTLVGFDIYPQDASLAHFAVNFGLKEIYGLDHLTWLTARTGEIRLIVPNSKKITFNSEISSLSSGTLTLATKDNKILKTIEFNQNRLSQKLTIENIQEGFYNIRLSWSGELHGDNKDERTLAIMFKNSILQEQ